LKEFQPPLGFILMAWTTPGEATTKINERNTYMKKQPANNQNSGLSAAVNFLPLAAQRLRFGPQAGLIALALASAALLALTSPLRAALMNPAFTYQGRLYDSGSAVSSSYDLQFTLLSGPNLPVSTPGCMNPVTVRGVAVTNGLFTVSLPFCAEAFDGSDRWLQVAVSPPNIDNFAILGDAQKITATPYAVHADTARTATLAETATSADVTTRALSLDAAARVPWSSITGAPTTIGTSYSAGAGIRLDSGVFSLDASFLDGQYWKLGGNVTSGINALGTINDAALELVAHGQRILRLESGTESPNLIGGNANNLISAGVSGGTIGGGGYYSHSPETLFSPSSTTDDKNSVTDDYGTVGGGRFNRAGNNNGSMSDAAFATIGGGRGNTAAGLASTVSGGERNTANGAYGAIAGGAYNRADGDYSFAAGRSAKALHAGSFVWADSTSEDFASTMNDQFSVRAGGGIRLDGNVSTMDNQVYLHSGSTDYGIGYRDNVGTVSVDGPFVYGFDGGALGGSDPETVALTWNWEGDVSVMHDLSTATLTIRGGADLAEPFKLSGKDIPQGAVVVIDEENPGQLKMSSHAYDTQVAGIISGAKGIHPGISLHQEGALEGGQNVALTGRVYVQADASYGPIKPGDLLTTSNTPGHAMKVSNHAKAQGAIIGKAMSGLKGGKGMVLVLVTLQ
jgi:hypothetical protein